MRFRNPAKRIWSTSWTRSTGLEASCRFHWTRILWQGFWISPPLKPQLVHNIENKHGSAIAICTCKISVLTSKLSNSISFKKSKINSPLNDKIFRRFLLTRRRRKTCSEWENCPRGLCFPTALLSHWTERDKYVEFPTLLWCLTTCHMLKGPQGSPRLLSAIARWKKEPRAISQTCTFGQQPLHSPKIPPWATIFLRNVQNLEIKLRNLKASAAPSTRAS